MGNINKLSGTKIESKKPRAGALSRAILKRKELIGLATGAVLTATAANAQWKDSPKAVTHGQLGGNGAPYNVYLDSGKTQAMQIFASTHGGTNIDLYCAKSTDGADTFGTEFLLDDSALTSKINSAFGEYGAAVRYNSGTGKYDLYYISDSIGAYEVYESLDFDLANCKAKNEPTMLPWAAGKINEAGEVSHLTIDPVANDKLYYTADDGTGGKFYVSDFGVWDKTAVAGFTDTADNLGLAVFDGKMIYSVKITPTNYDIQWKPFVSGAGVGATAKIETYPGMTAVINDTGVQGNPMVDTKGILWYASGSPGKLYRKDPVTGGTDAGAGGTGGIGGTGGTAGTGGTGGTGGTSGSGGVDSGAGTGGSAGTAGTGGNEAGTDGGFDAAPDATGTGGTAGTGGSAGSGGMAGSAGEAGAAGSAGSGGIDAGGQGGTAGMAGSAGNAGAEAGGAAGAAGETGTDAGPDGIVTPACADTFIFTAGEGGLTITDCDDKHITGVYDGKHEVDIKSPDGKLLALHKAAGGKPQTVSWTLPNFVKIPAEVDYGFEENPGDSAKWVFQEEGGTPLGAEASKGEHFNPDAANLNPELAQGKVRVRAYQMIEGTERMFNDKCLPTPSMKIFDSCQPQTFSINGDVNGRIPAGSTIYRELATGRMTTNPDELAVTVEPVTKEKDPSCSCETVQSHTSGNIYALLGGAFIGIAMARRRKNGIAKEA